jgi:outer membrane lipoprotein carrier protein
MNIKSALAAVVIAFIAITPTQAQDKKDPKAQEILKGVSAKYKSMKSFAASFKVTTRDQKNNTTDNQTGSLLVKGDKYRLIIKGQEIISDGKTSWTILKESNEVQINEVAEKSDAITPTNIFTIYEKGFSSKFTGEKNVDNILMQQIELVPEDAKKSFFKIQLNINKADKVISSAKIFDKNGTHYTYSIEMFKANAEAPETSFTFDQTKYQGFDVIDLR